MATLAEQRYLPFGAVRTDVGAISQTDFGYTGQRNSDFGLMDYHARWYAPSLGKFTQPDTIVPNPGNPQSWNRYSYVNNNPINNIDPTGHCAFAVVDTLGCATIVLGTLAFVATVAYVANPNSRAAAERAANNFINAVQDANERARRRATEEKVRAQKNINNPSEPDNPDIPQFNPKPPKDARSFWTLVIVTTVTLVKIGYDAVTTGGNGEPETNLNLPTLTPTNTPTPTRTNTPTSTTSPTSLRQYNSDLFRERKLLYNTRKFGH